MMNKLSKIFFPTLLSFITFGWLLKLEEIYHDYIFQIDPSFDSGPQIDIPLYIILFIPFLFALLFQATSVIPFWNTITNHKLFLRAKLWKYILFLLLFLTIVLLLFSSAEDGPGKESFKFYIIMLSMFIIFWLFNFLTLWLIDRIKYNR